MRDMKKIFVSLILLSCIESTAIAALSDLLDPVNLSNKISHEIDQMNLSFSTGFPNGSIIDGLPIGAQFDYDVGPSYLPHTYNRIDKYDINMNINVGTIIKELSTAPLSFGITRNQSFFFVRQFSKKTDALLALPYLPNRIPINAKRAIEKLEVGDFASIPANLSLAINAGASTSIVNPLVINASANAYWIISGEFNIQVYKLDNKHIRLKMITTRAYNHGGYTNTEASFTVFGINALNRQIDRLFDRQLVQLGMSISPGSQFILDYIFDLTDPKAQDAYNEIMGASFQFKDAIVLKNFGENNEIKNKLFKTYEKADLLFSEDNKLPIEKQRVRRLFKGFTNSTARTKHLKLGFFLTSYTNDQTYTDNNLTFIDNKENETDFTYPTYNQFKRSLLGNWWWGYEDIESLTCFGLLPKFKSLADGPKIPEIGLNYDRTDAVFTPLEQRKFKKLLNNQIPSKLTEKIAWENILSHGNKHIARSSFKLIIKESAYHYLGNYTETELEKNLIKYAAAKDAKHLTLAPRIRILAGQLYSILQNKKNNIDQSLKDLIALNKNNIFRELGVGFLTSLLPEDKLQDLVYLKLEMLALDEPTIKLEVGQMNFEVLYNELAEIQSKIANRSYDLRVPNPVHP
jgi:hypothetical protein